MAEVNLKEYVEKILAEKDRAIQAALASAEKAVAKAEAQSEKWRDNANEWRGAMNDRERDFLTRREFYSIIGTAIGVVGLLYTLVAKL